VYTTVPAPLPLEPAVIWSEPGFDEVAVQGPQDVPGVTVSARGTSGPTPQFGCPELLGQVSTVEVPVAGRLADAGASPNTHDGTPELKLAVTLTGPFIAAVVEPLEVLATGPVQPAKTYPAAGVAEMFTAPPEL
jgi:hypothetical protein